MSYSGALYSNSMYAAPDRYERELKLQRKSREQEVWSKEADLTGKPMALHSLLNVRTHAQCAMHIMSFYDVDPEILVRSGKTGTGCGAFVVISVPGLGEFRGRRDKVWFRRASRDK